MGVDCCCTLSSSSYSLLSSPPSPSTSSIRSPSSNTSGSRIEGEVNTLGVNFESGRSFAFVSLTIILAGDIPVAAAAPPPPPRIAPTVLVLIAEAYDSVVLRTTLRIELAEDPTSRSRSRIEGALVLAVVEVPVEG